MGLETQHLGGGILNFDPVPRWGPELSPAVFVGPNFTWHFPKRGHWMRLE